MAEVHRPTVVAPSPQNEAKLVRFPDDSLRIYYVERSEGKNVRSVGSTDGGMTWGDDRLEFALPGAAYYAIHIIPDDAGELHAVFHIFRGEGRQPGVDRNLDVWHCRTTSGQQEWGPPQRIYVGYVGALRGGIQLRSGRLIVPLSIAIPERRTAPPAGEPDYGWHDIIVLHSDDLGATWQRGPAALRVTLCGENVTRYGAVEPHVIELRDGRTWMLIRDRCGRLYESYATDGSDWSEPQRTRFISSDSPATTVRLPDDRIVLFWCADQRWDNPRSYAMGGREALHAAISADEGRTWQGFREVLTEPLPPAQRGDRGTAYPTAVCNAQGKIVLASGQGQGRQAVVLFDPDWLTETTAHDDFSAGLEQWTLYGASGPGVVPHPDRDGGQVLAIRKPDAEAPAGALWNFPAGHAGQVTIRLRVREGFQGATVWLTDHFSVIDDRDAPANGVVSVKLESSGGDDGAVSIEPERWHELTLEWPADGGPASVRLDGRAALSVSTQRRSETGVNYLGIRSAAATTDDAGLLIEAVEATVEPPAMAALPAEENRGIPTE